VARDYWKSAYLQTYVSSAPTKADRRSGRELALALGWPRESIGFWGASSAMLDIGAPWQQMDSMLAVVDLRQRQADLQTQMAVLRGVATVLEPTAGDS
jgi:hypothetical protein